MSRLSHQRKQAKAMALIRLRYLLPVLTLGVIILSALIPCLRFISVQAGSLGTESLLSWLFERWDTARANLLSGGSDVSSAAGLQFVKREFTLLTVCWICFFAGAVMTVYMTVKVFDILREPRKFDNGRAVFLTLVPNRTLFCLYQLLLFPLLFLPRFWLLMAQKQLLYNITLHLSFAEPWMLAVGLYLLQVALSIISAREEYGVERNPFLAKLPEPSRREEAPSESATPAVSEADRADRAEQIRRLLADDVDDQDNSTEE